MFYCRYCKLSFKTFSKNHDLYNKYKILQLLNYKLLSPDFDRETVGSESVVSYDTAEQSFVTSEVDGRDNISEVLKVMDKNPETLALAVTSPNPVRNKLTINNTPQLRLNIPTNSV